MSSIREKFSTWVRTQVRDYVIEREVERVIDEITNSMVPIEGFQEEKGLRHISKFIETNNHFQVFCEASDYGRNRLFKTQNMLCFGQRFVKESPTDDYNSPVTMVNLNEDVRYYCQWLTLESASLGKPIIPYIPSIEIWNYVKTGGKNGKGYKYAGSDNHEEVAISLHNAANGTIDGRPKPRAVGMLKPNEMGIYDLSGNTWEWSCTAEGYEGYTSVDKDGNIKVYDTFEELVDEVILKDIHENFEFKGGRWKFVNTEKDLNRIRDDRARAYFMYHECTREECFRMMLHNEDLNPERIIKIGYFYDDFNDVIKEAIKEQKRTGEMPKLLTPLTAHEIMQHENIQLRQVFFAALPAGIMLDNLEATLIKEDTVVKKQVGLSEIDGEWYEVEYEYKENVKCYKASTKFFRDNIGDEFNSNSTIPEFFCFLEYKCPSTSKKYITPVDPKFLEKEYTVWDALAWICGEVPSNTIAIRRHGDMPQCELPRHTVKGHTALEKGTWIKFVDGKAIECSKEESCGIISKVGNGFYYWDENPAEMKILTGEEYLRLLVAEA